MALEPGQIVSQSRVGVNRYTGKLIYGWDHCLQCITRLVTTALNTRVMRLDYGSDIPNLIDRPATAAVIMSWYVAIDQAIRNWEPGYRIKSFALSTAGPDGAFGIDLSGLFYPRGHLGDYSVVEQRTATIIIKSAAT